MNILFSDGNEFDKINPHCLLFYFFVHMCQIFGTRENLYFPLVIEVERLYFL